MQGQGALIAWRSPETPPKVLIVEGCAFAAFLPALAITLRPESAAASSFFSFYMLCAVALLAGYLFGGLLSHARRSVSRSAWSHSCLLSTLLATVSLGIWGLLVTT